MSKDTISYSKGLPNKKNLTILNIYAPNMGVAKSINQLITKLFTEMNSSSKQKISKEIKALNDTLDQMDITDIFRTFHLMQQNIHSSFVHIEHYPE